jgi:hypothetical protein
MLQLKRGYEPRSPADHPMMRSYWQSWFAGAWRAFAPPVPTLQAVTRMVH